jgi:hypothetical protein
MTPSWLTIFLDLPAARREQGARFWQAATGYGLSPSRGEQHEFATLVPPTGDAHLRIQRTGAEEPGVHLDLHVADVDLALAHALDRGAELVARPGHAILRSPAGFVFCLVTATGTERTTPPTDWGTHRSRVDQLTVDVAYDAWEAEQSFWSGLTGWQVRRGSRPEYARLGTPAELPVRILLQRLDEGETHGHVDVAADDRGREVARLESHGARVTRRERGWTVLTGPDGSTLCVTDRRPETGLLS